MDDEQNDDARDIDEAPAPAAAYPYGSYEQAARTHALSLAHDNGVDAANVVARASAYAAFIIG